MIDIHSHILYGVDDGAETIEESIKLLKQAENIGYTDIVCSSHYYIGKFENKNYNKNFELLKKEIKKNKIKIKIYKGNEFALKEEGLKDIEKVNKVNLGNYLLIELKGMIIYPICKKLFQELLDNNIIPIFAHVERYPHIKQKELEELYHMGVVLQVNLKTILDLPLKIKNLFNKRYIGIVATDTHRFGKRDYDVREYLEKLEKIVGKEYFNLLTEENPRKILNNEKIEKGRELDEIKKINRNISIFSYLWNKLFRV